MTLPEGWRQVELQSLATQSPRAIVDGPFGSNLASKHYTSSGPRVVRLQNIGEGEFLDVEAHISETHFESLQRHEVQAGDLLIASLGDPVLRACLAPVSLGPAIVKADFIRVRLNDDIDARWVLYAMENERTKRWAAAHAHGVGRTRLGLKVIRSIPVPLPPLDEQRRIVGILEGHLTRVASAESAMSAARTRTSLLYESWLSGALTQPSEEERKLGSLLREPMRNGHSAPAAPSGAIRVVTLTAITRGDFSERWSKMTNADPKHVKGLWLEPGDVLVERSNTPDLVGSSAIYRGARDWAIFPDLAVRLRADPTVIIDEFLALALASLPVRRYFRARAKGLSGSMPKIDQGTIGAAVIRVPPLDDQQRVVRAAGQFEEALGLLQQEVAAAQRRVSALRRALLDAAFSGRLTGRASDLDRAEEAVEQELVS